MVVVVDGLDEDDDGEYEVEEEVAVLVLVAFGVVADVPFDVLAIDDEGSCGAVTESDADAVEEMMGTAVIEVTTGIMGA